MHGMVSPHDDDVEETRLPRAWTDYSSI